MTRAWTSSEPEIVLNKANLALSKSSRLIASWLPPRKAEELRNAKSREEIESEEQGIFVATPELLGLGAALPKDGDVKRQELSTNDKLRKQLLGKDHAKKQNKEAMKAHRPGQMNTSKPRPISTKLEPPVYDSDDEGGRSSLFKSKRKRSQGNEDPTKDTTSIQKQSSPRGDPEDALAVWSLNKGKGNYLDEVLAEKSRKKQKKK